MGRLAASVGFGLGKGLSAGISEKRKQDAEDKRAQELRTAAIKKIADAQQFQIDQIEEKRLFDADLKLKEDIEADKTNRALGTSLGMDFSKNPGLITNKVFGPAIKVKTELLKIEQKNEEVKLKIQREKNIFDLGLSISDKLIEATGKDTPGKETITPGEKSDIAKSVGASPKQVSEIFKQTFVGDETDTRFNQLIKAANLERDFSGKLTELGRTLFNQALEIKGFVPPQIGFTQEAFDEAIRDRMKSQNITEGQAAQELFATYSDKDLKIIRASGIKIPITEESIGVRQRFKEFFGFDEESRLARIQGRLPSRKQTIKQEPIEETQRLSGFGQSLLPKVSISDTGRIRKKKNR